MMPSSLRPMLPTSREARKGARKDYLLAHPSGLNAVSVTDPESGWVWSTPRRRKVAIVGFAPSRAVAPLEDPTWDVWACNNLMLADPQGRFRADRWFEIHAWEVIDDLDWVRRLPIPVYMMAPCREVPMSVRYPLERVLTEVPTRFFACTMAYQIALAIVEGAQEIGLFGIELHRGTVRERLVERASVAYWLGVAEGRGIRVRLPHGSGLLKHPLYGLDYWVERFMVAQEVRALRVRTWVRQEERTRAADQVNHEPAPLRWPASPGRPLLPPAEPTPPLALPKARRRAGK